jgi:crotonobetainyl-CoA:carnitine CoA-transferase CaiB-like acyl-CoA transferase
MVRIAGSNFVRYSRDGAISERVGSVPLDNPPKPPKGLQHGLVYQTRDGRWVSMFPVTDQQWGLLGKVIPEICAPEFSLEVIHENPHAPDPVIRKWILERDFDVVMKELVDGGLPVSPIYNTADIVADEHAKARGNVLAEVDYKGNPILMQGIVPRLVNQPGEVRWAGEALGASNHAVYADLLGLTHERIAHLKAINAI